ncbi:expressed unknown protein [Seminavis robusta]|uniref:VWFD domain-containing protein n=1 Tax=Seminavis robusta TaxID=568900 RepID=A0A9N8EX48_9STRA|nr:expressed unknown protein [Seminavis robusta]|eukprot:Sro2212_g319251.1  (421) ;mRNA; f:6407-7923
MRCLSFAGQSRFAVNVVLTALLITDLWLPAAAVIQCCDGSCGNNCLTVRELVFWYACETGTDCSTLPEVWASHPRADYCCGPVDGPHYLPLPIHDPVLGLIFPSFVPDIADVCLYGGAFQYPNGATRDIWCNDMRHFAYAENGATLACNLWGTLGPGLFCGTGDYGFSGGDPHFKTWIGEWYDYHGVCDLVFLHAPDAAGGLRLDIHIRTKARYEYSYITSAAIRIGNGEEDVLEVASWGNYMLGGIQNAELPGLLADKYPVIYTRVSDKEHRFTIQLDDDETDGEKVVMTVFKDLVSIKIENSSYESFGSSRGLLGDFLTGAFAARNGTFIPSDDPTSFAESWQVQEDEPKLFQDSKQHPQHPAQCIRPDPAAKDSRRLGESVAREAAIAACSHWEHQDACVYDVMATGDLDLAEATPY